MNLTKKLWIGIAVLIALSPLGLFLPNRFKTGSAWGEWGSEEIRRLVGYVPHGFNKLSNIWNAPMPDYAFKGWEKKALSHLSLAYIISALIGISIVVVVTVAIGKLLTKKEK